MNSLTIHAVNVCTGLEQVVYQARIPSADHCVQRPAIPSVHNGVRVGSCDDMTMQYVCVYVVW